MRSMTGFGLGDVPIGGGKLGVEIRGVNHRFLDVRVRLPRELADLSGFVEQVARERLVRGRYEVALRVEGTLLGAPVLDADLPLRLQDGESTRIFGELDDVIDALEPRTKFAYPYVKASGTVYLARQRLDYPAV